MIIIADSGSTKTTWNLITRDQKTQTCNTSGINPFFLGKEEIMHILETEFSLPSTGISSVYFYGAGCIPAKISVLSEPLTEFFGTSSVEVHSDLLAAARSLCQNQPGIACILGTGSNSCFYDGKEIVRNISPLGFILGDEGSGAVLGKKLVADILKEQLPLSIREDFFATYSFTAAEILENVYRKPFPNRFLAKYTPFIAKHIDKQPMVNLVETAFSEFIQRNLLNYDSARNLPIHFTGSIAFYFKNNLENAMKKHGLQLGQVSQAPMEGLINYHLNLTNKTQHG